MSPSKITTAREILDKTAAFFTEKRIPSPRLDAEVLLAEVLGYDRLRLYMNLDRPMNEGEITRAREMVRRRVTREPVAYIIGRKEFAGRDFKVGPGVLIPRPDTEILVEEAARELRERFDADQAGRAAREGDPDMSDQAGQPDQPDPSHEAALASPGEPLCILEFGVGSGAIAVSLAADNHRVRVIATEINEAAAAIAGENAAAHGVADRIEIKLQPDFNGIKGPFHAIISNPPYIDPAEKSALAPDVASYEPADALFAESAGLHWYKFLAAEAVCLLAPQGFIAVEIGYRQREAVEGIFTAANLKLVRSMKDFGGNDRVVIAER